jgi:hypothetical protein
VVDSLLINFGTFQQLSISSLLQITFFSKPTRLRSSIGSHLLKSTCHPRRMTISNMWKSPSTIRRYNSCFLRRAVFVGPDRACPCSYAEVLGSIRMDNDLLLFVSTFFRHSESSLPGISHRLNSIIHMFPTLIFFLCSVHSSTHVKRASHSCILLSTST